MRMWLPIGGITALALAVSAGDRLVGGEACVASPELLGDPPRGYRYAPAPPEVTEAGDLRPDDDVYLARRPGTKGLAYVVLARVPEGEERDLDLYAQAGTPEVSRRARIGRHDVVLLSTEDGGWRVAGYKGC